MFGMKIGNKYLVEGAVKDEWIFMWFVTQFISHEWYTIFGKGVMGNVENKISYFKDCIQLVHVPGRYVPDLYHIILHMLVVAAFVATVIVANKEETLILGLLIKVKKEG